jgi:hypothetical protein
MTKLKAVGFHLLCASADATFRLQASPLAVQKFTSKFDIDPQIGDDSKKGPPGIITVDLVTRLTTQI